MFFLLSSPKNLLIKSLIFLSPLWLFFFFNLLTSPFPNSTLIYLFHFSLYSLTAKILVNQYRHRLSLPLVFSLTFQFLLGLIQVFRSKAGTFYWLGERNLSLSTLGVAKTSFFNFFTLRAYGTFSHPNALAGWSILVLIVLFSFSSRRLVRLTSLVLTLGILGITQSRLALFAFLVWFLITNPLNFRPPKFWLTPIFTCLFFWQLSSFRPLAIQQRLGLILTSFKLSLRWPWFGTGLGSSLAAYTKIFPPQLYLQPDHNSLTLFLSQTGLFGLFSLYFLFRSFISRYQLKPHFFLSFFLPSLSLLLFDHYLLTSSQGLFIINLFFYEFISD